MARPLDPQKSTRIVDAARRVFGERGFHRTGVADIAGALGIGHGTVYRYFKNKLEVFDAVVEAALAGLLQSLVDERPDAAEDLDAYRAQVRRIGERLAAHLQAHPEAARVIFVEAVGIDPRISARLQAARVALTQFTAAYLRNGVDRGFLRSDLDVDMAARVLNACILDAGRELLALGDASEIDTAMDNWLRGVDQIVFFGMAAPTFAARETQTQ